MVFYKNAENERQGVLCFLATIECQVIKTASYGLANSPLRTVISSRIGTRTS